MAIIYAKRIPSGLSGPESCGPNQQWDPNFVFNGIKGQCTPRFSPMTPAPSTSTGFWGALATGLDAFKTATTPAPVFAPMPYVPPQQGMSTTTMLLLGLGAAGLLAFALTRK